MIRYASRFSTARLLQFTVATAIVVAMVAGIARLPAASTDAVKAFGEELRFAVYRDGSPMGRHSVSFREEDGDLHVEIDIELEVGIAFVTLFRYKHKNHEIWRDGKLIAMNSKTDDDGDHYEVTARATDEGLLVEGPNGSFVAPADILPTTYWNAETINQTQLLDTQKGRIVQVNVQPAGKETVDLANGQVRAKRYDIDGDLNLSIWYGPDKDWTKMAFRVRGSDVDYTRRGPAPARQLTSPSDSGRGQAG